jgi:hypothetical protein
MWVGSLILRLESRSRGRAGVDSRRHPIIPIGGVWPGRSRVQDLPNSRNYGRPKVAWD